MCFHLYTHCPFIHMGVREQTLGAEGHGSVFISTAPSTPSAGPMLMGKVQRKHHSPVISLGPFSTVMQWLNAALWQACCVSKSNKLPGSPPWTQVESPSSLPLGPSKEEAGICFHLPSNSGMKMRKGWECLHPFLFPLFVLYPLDRTWLHGHSKSHWWNLGWLPCSSQKGSKLKRQVVDPATCIVQIQIHICLEFQAKTTWLPPKEQASLPILKLRIFLIKYKPISSKCPPASSGEPTDGGKSNGQRATAFGVFLPQTACFRVSRCSCGQVSP